MSIRTLIGLFLIVYAILALSGPGRIDINDGQTRYEVARSLWEHGDTQIRDPEVWYPILKGPDGKTYTNYRLPHSVLGVPAIILADLAGPSEARRHFYFALLGAVAGATLAVGYAVWFFGHGYSRRSALFWAAAGIFCTPSWFYSTSTFDDIFGATTVILALTWAWLSRERGTITWALLAGLAVGAALNWKPPLAIFLLPTLAAAGGDEKSRARWAMILAGVALGLVVYQGYEWLRFPPGYVRPDIKHNPPIWNATPAAAAVALLISPVCGAIWYCPPVVLGVAGLLMRASRRERIWAASVFLACAGFFASICLLAFFKGNIAWGPRYLTPVFAVLWLFTPSAAAVAGRWRSGIILGLGLIVQLLALTTDPHRVYIVNNAPPDALFHCDSLYYHLPTSHLFARPTEIADVLTNDATPRLASPAPSPTYALPPPGCVLIESSVAQRYYVFASFRPWWCWQRHLAAADRPVDLARTASLLLAIAVLGAILLVCPQSLTEG